MNRNLYMICISIVAFATTTIAQTYNPYKSIGKEAKVLTLSNGKYEEFFDTDTIEIIGSAILNTKTMTIIGFYVPDTLYSESTLEPEIVSRWLSPDPLAVKYPEMSPYHFVKNNPIIYIDPDGRENKYALAWARQNMSNQKKPFKTWYGSDEGGWVYNPGKIPNYTVCYEACWTAYMSSMGNITPYLKETGFATKSGGFKGRSTPTGGMNWFKQGDGTDRSFVTDISKGELGDIAFMGEVGDMQGHAVLLAELPKMGSITDDKGNIIETMTLETLSTSSDSDPGNYGERTMTFQKVDGKWKLDGTGYEFQGYGQLNEEKFQGDPKLLEEKKTETNTGTGGN